MKKFLCFVGATLVLVLMVLYMGYKYLLPKDYPVFIESFEHGVMTIESEGAIGEDNKFEIFCKKGQKVTVNINPERSDSAYYDLSKLTVNGVDVTDKVNMLEYSFEVEGKTTVLAYFKKGKKPSSSSTEETDSRLSAPDIVDYAKNQYLGSANAYDVKDPSIIYNEANSTYYCFASNNVVLTSKDLFNWEKRTNYFNYPTNAETKEIMSFSQFDSVREWASDHGYDSDETVSTTTNERRPLSPEIIKIGSTYYLYFTLSKEHDANESAIFCVKTNDLESAVSSKQWEEVGLVVSSCGHHSSSDEGASYDAANCTHPSVFADKNSSHYYMAYGSYYGKDNIKGSINLLEIDPETGLLESSSSINSTGDEISTLHGSKRFNAGITIANPGKIPSLGKEDGSLVSACDVVYDSDSDYYYLFITYGCSDTNYEIRVARSKDPEGPYLDMNDNDMASYGNSASNNQYTKGTLVISGYNFSMSSNGGVSYTDVGKASVGAPSIFKNGDGKWLMSSQARAYYKIDGNIYCGDTIAEENDYSTLSSSALEIRQLYFREDWPYALPEVFDNENLDDTFEKSDLTGHWDVIVFSGSQPSGDYKDVTRYTSQKVSLFNNCAITESNINGKKKKNTKLDNGSFKKVDSKTYTIKIDGTVYTVYPTYAWDNELDQVTMVFVGTGEDGKLIWGKKGYNSYKGIYLDLYNYLIDLSAEDVQETYQKKLDKISENPTQEAIDKFCSQLIKKILSTY